MQYASDTQKSQMVAVAGAPIENISIMINEIKASTGESSLWVANYLAPDVFTLGGSCTACKSVKKEFKRFGFKSAIVLPVSGAFHTHYMLPAVDLLEAAINEAKISLPNIPVTSNVTGEWHSRSSISDLRQLLIDQLTAPVQWDRCIDSIIASNIFNNNENKGTEIVVYDIGPGSVCSNLLKRKQIPSLNVHSVLA